MKTLKKFEAKKFILISFLFIFSLNIFANGNSVIVTTYAGTGFVGSQDGDALTEAKFGLPTGISGFGTGICFDNEGNLLVADAGNNKIRKISPIGQVTTIAGSGIIGYLDGPANVARFNFLADIAVDSIGNIYIADGNNNRIRKLDTAGIVSTLAGSGACGSADGSGTSASFCTPTDVEIDKDGNIIVADLNGNAIRKITPAGNVTTIKLVNNPVQVAVDKEGNIFFTTLNRIMKIDTNGIETLIAGGPTAGFADGTGAAAKFNEPWGIALDNDGNIYIGDQQNHRVRKIDTNNVVTTLAGTGVIGFKDGPADSAQFNVPSGLCHDATGRVFVADQGNNRIRVIGPKIVEFALFECAVDSLLKKALQEDTTLAKLIEEQEKIIQDYIKEHLDTATGNTHGPSFVIPVVVHVIHNGEALGVGTNISDEQIDAQIEALNRAFSNLDGSTNAYAHNPEITFCLAQNLPDITNDWNTLNPNGKPGVVRINDPKLSQHDINFRKKLNCYEFPPSRYLNIYVVSEIIGGPIGTLGYAPTPIISNDVLDGIVIRHDVFGDNTICPPGPCNTLMAGYDQGKVLVHEVGHYLFLYHTFQGGCLNTDCENHGDICCDTPPVNAPNFFCPTGTNSCDTDDDDSNTKNPYRPITNGGIGDQPDMIENYMDYTLDSCKNTITRDQVNRMISLLSNFRQKLVSAENLVLTGVTCNGPHTALIADFEIEGTQICRSINTTFRTIIAGNNATSYSWVFNGGSPATANTPGPHNVIFNTDGIYDISLTVDDGIGGGSITATKTIFVSSCNIIDQTQANWYFGDNAAIKFSDSEPTISITPPPTGMFSQEGCASTSDMAGDLLFYTNGVYVFDKNGNIMPGGTLNGNPNSISINRAYSSSQGAIIVPDPNPNNNNLYFIFSNSDIGTINNGLNYRVIDMSLRSGLGDVIGVNTPVPGDNPNTTEHLSAVPNCNSDGYWIIAHGLNSGNENKLYAYLLDNSSVLNLPVVSNSYSIKQPVKQNAGIGQITVSRNSKWVAISNDNIGGLGENKVYIYCFDRENGNFERVTALPQGSGPYGLEFSPNSNILYSLGNEGVKQYDLSNLNKCDTMVPSYLVTPAIQIYNSLQIGPDNKIYISNEDKQFLSVINFPDVLNITGNNECGLNLKAIDLGCKISNLGLPNMIDALLTKSSVNFEFCMDDCGLVHFRSLTCGTNFQWNFDDGNTSTEKHPSHLFKLSGNYQISLSVDGSAPVVHNVAVNLVQGSFVAANETCTGALDGSINLTVIGGTLPYSYLWLPDGQITEDLANIGAGDYKVVISDANECTDTLEISLFDPAVIHCYCPRSYTEIIGTGSGIETISGGKTFNGTYLINTGTLQLENGTYNLVPGTILYMKADASINLLNTTFLMEGATVTAECDSIWNGIFSSGNNIITIVENGTDSSEISNSTVGIVLSSERDNFSIQKTRFFNNVLSSIQINDQNSYTATNNDNIRYNSFYSNSQTMLIPYNQQTDIDPLLFYVPETFILLSGQNNSTLIANNKFSQAIYGISGTEKHKTRNSMNVQNNEFHNIGYFTILCNDNNWQNTTSPGKSTINNNKIFLPANYLKNIQGGADWFFQPVIGIVYNGWVEVNNNTITGTATLDVLMTEGINSAGFVSNAVVSNNNISGTYNSIVLGGGSPGPTLVDGNIIDNTKFGIYLLTSNATVKSNTISNIVPSVITALDNEWGQFDNFGIYNNFLYSFISANNISGSVSPSPTVNGTYSILVNETKNRGTIVFDNTISGTDFGVQSQERNPLLKIRCNNFAADGTPHNVTGWATLPLGGKGSLMDQGYCKNFADNTPAGNEWLYACPILDNTSNIFVDPSISFVYSSHSLNTSFQDFTIPDCGSTQWVSNDLKDCQINKQPTSCLSAFASPTSPNPKDSAHIYLAGLQVKMEEKETERNEALNQIDCGRTGELLALLSGNIPSGNLKDSLLFCSPYLSDTVLIALVNSSYPPGIIKEIILANSPVTETVYSAVINRTPGLSKGIINEINAAQAGTSARAEVERIIAYITGDIHLVEQEIMRIELLEGNVQKVIDMLKQDDDIDSKKMLAELYLSNGNYAEGKRIIDSIAQTGGEENENFGRFHQLLFDMDADSATIFNMKPQHLQTLSDIAGTNTEISFTAQSILHLVAGKPLKLPVAKISQPSSKTAKQENYNALKYDEEEKLILVSEIKLYPNPTKGEIIIEIQEKYNNSVLVIKNILGKEVISYPLNSGTTSINLPEFMYKQGVYFYEIVNSSNKVGSGKLVIIR